MAQRKEFHATPRLSPPPLQWFTKKYPVHLTRDGRGDVLISLKVPRDIVNRHRIVREDDQRTFWYTNGPLELIHLEEILEPVTHPQQDYKREDLAP